jgi:hypothetical protein
VSYSQLKVGATNIYDPDTTPAKGKTSRMTQVEEVEKSKNRRHRKDKRKFLLG